VFAGRITRSSLITAAGTESTPITILAGMTAFIPVAAFADLTRQSLVIISSTARTQPAQRSETMAGPTRSAWRRAQSGLLAVTWTRATAHRRHIWSACNLYSRLTQSDITAPGTDTRSCDNSCDSCYTFASGTSMATPHISGAMALLWSAIPGLQNQIQASRDALNSTTVQIQDAQCGNPTPPNNVYGWGRVNIAAAVGTPPPTPSPDPTPPVTATPCGPTATPTPTATATATPTTTPTPSVTPTATPTATPPFGTPTPT